jgi:hypothetical protein
MTPRRAASRFAAQASRLGQMKARAVSASHWIAAHWIAADR